MNILNLRSNPKKLKNLSITKLEHVIQLIDIEVVNYNRATENYSEEKHERFSVPHLKGWSRFKEAVIVVKEQIEEKSRKNSDV